MLVHKFGGALVKSAEAVKNLGNIVGSFTGNMLVVVSAMGKTTNSLEIIADHYFNRSGNTYEKLLRLKDYHYEIMHGLFRNKNHLVFDDVNSLFEKLASKLKTEPSDKYDFEYDQVVSFGELFSACIISSWLNDSGIKNKWTDARKCLLTNNVYRDAIVLTEDSKSEVKRIFNFKNENIYVTQGFIGSDKKGNTTTLGREGSDYSASILAYLLNAEKVIIWKDVEGIFNIDPCLHNNPEKLDEISYQEAIELAYYGAKVIHPKTIKPLQNKNIPLYVKSFLEPEKQGTVIHEIDHPVQLVPVYIFKKNQVLISLSPKDFSFIAEENISSIFALIAKYHAKVNLLQNSAISLSVCIDFDERKSPLLIRELKKNYRVLYNENTELITIRHYNEKAIAGLLGDRIILLEQKSRLTAQFVVK